MILGSSEDLLGTQWDYRNGANHLPVDAPHSSTQAGPSHPSPPWRRYHAAQPSPPPHRSLYGVWDGHGGIEAADFASDAVPRQLARHPALSRPWVGTCAESDAADVATVEGAGGGDGCADRGEAEGEGGDGCASVLGQVMRLVDNDYLALAQREAHRSGTTARHHVARPHGAPRTASPHACS